MLDEIEDIESDFRINANGMTRVRDVESALELFDSFSFFYYLTV